MLADYGTREHRHLLPTPFRDANSGRVTIPVGPPTLPWLAYLIGLINLAGVALTALEKQNHTSLTVMSYTVCGVAAGVTGRWVRARGGAVYRGHVCFVVVAVSAWMAPPVSAAPLSSQVGFVAVGAVLALLGVGVYRLAGRNCALCRAARR